MFDPVTSTARRLYLKNKFEEEMDKGLSRELSHRCSLCGKKVEKLFDGRCIKCATKIASAIFHHQLPPSKYKVLQIKKRIDEKK